MKGNLLVLNLHQFVSAHDLNVYLLVGAASFDGIERDDHALVLVGVPGAGHLTTFPRESVANSAIKAVDNLHVSRSLCNFHVGRIAGITPHEEE